MFWSGTGTDQKLYPPLTAPVRGAQFQYQFIGAISKEARCGKSRTIVGGAFSHAPLSTRGHLRNLSQDGV